MEFASIPSGSYELGWRYSHLVTDDMAEGLAWIGWSEGRSPRLSESRTATLSQFDIATHATPISELIGNPYEIDESVASLSDLCNLVDDLLRNDGLRLPTEDELEAACGGGSLFPWGNDIPDGIPYGSQTTFTHHESPLPTGLVLLSNPYNVELVRCAMKLGDGGEAICGGYPWPAAWLALSPSFRMLDDDVEPAFHELLEETYIRPVRLRR